MNVLAYTTHKEGNSITLACNDGRTVTTDSWFDTITFLLEQPCQYAVVPDIDEFTEAFCSLLPDKASEDLHANERIVLQNGERLFYSITRKLSIGYGYRGNKRNEVDIYGLSRYTDKEITNPDELYTLWREVIKAFALLGCTPQGLSSPIGAYESLLDRLPFARACDLPQEAMPLIDKCSGVSWEEWREVYKLGHWNASECTDCDLSGAYPSLIARLPDLSHATFYESDTMPDNYSWGLLDGELRIDADVTPFGYVGTTNKLITTGQLRQIQMFKWGAFSLNHGYFIKIPKYEFPFGDTMNNLYKARQSDNVMVKNNAKAISVGIGGKFDSRYGDRPGKNYNPIYAKMITSGCSSKVASFLWSKGLPSQLISVTVDGFLSEGKLPPMETNGMGTWRTEPESPFLVLSQLYQWGNDKKPNGKTYSKMTGLIKANPTSSVYDDVDFHLLEYTRDFGGRPSNGMELMTHKYNSRPKQFPIEEN